jgi:thiol-disulfide isomerase/thioredoxin
MKQSALIIVVAIVALAGGIITKIFLSPAEKSMVTALPAFSLPDLDGKLRHIDEWRGRVLIINFWATWCPPCRKEIPRLIALQQEYSTKGLSVISITTDDKKTVNEYAISNHINYPILIAKEEGIALARQLGNNVDAIPYTVVVNQHGQIVYRHSGEFSKEHLLEIIVPLIHSQK